MLTDLITLDRPLVSVDVETTGVSPTVDRVVQLGIVKLHIDGSLAEWETLVNPTIPIPEEASAVHGVTDEAVRGAPTFAQLAPKLLAGFAGCDLLGYNVASFDVRVLAEEFRRCGVAWEPGRVVDAFRIYQRVRPRNLTAAVSDFLDVPHERAHDALADARATLRLVEAQLLAHPELPRDVSALHDLFFVQARPGALDPDGRLVWKGGEACLGFGKHAGVSLRSLATVDRGYLEWVLRGEFSAPVKEIISEALAGKFRAKG